jgi:hypothetical protein
MTTFSKYGDEFAFMEKNETMNTYMFKRTNIETGIVYYEVVIPKKSKNPDGSTVYVYPGAESFGFGRGVCTRSLEKAEKYLNNGIQRIACDA